MRRIIRRIIYEDIKIIQSSNLSSVKESYSEFIAKQLLGMRKGASMYVYT